MDTHGLWILVKNFFTSSLSTFLIREVGWSTNQPSDLHEILRSHDLLSEKLLLSKGKIHIFSL